MLTTILFRTDINEFCELHVDNTYRSQETVLRGQEWETTFKTEVDRVIWDAAFQHVGHDGRVAEIMEFQIEIPTGLGICTCGRESDGSWKFQCHDCDEAQDVDYGADHEAYIASLPCACGSDEDNPCVCN